MKTGVAIQPLRDKRFLTPDQVFNLSFPLFNQLKLIGNDWRPSRSGVKTCPRAVPVVFSVMLAIVTFLSLIINCFFPFNWLLIMERKDYRQHLTGNDRKLFSLDRFLGAHRTFFSSLDEQSRERKSNARPREGCWAPECLIISWRVSA